MRLQEARVRNAPWAAALGIIDIILETGDAQKVFGYDTVLLKGAPRMLLDSKNQDATLKVRRVRNHYNCASSETWKAHTGVDVVTGADNMDIRFLGVPCAALLLENGYARLVLKQSSLDVGGLRSSEKTAHAAKQWVADHSEIHRLNTGVLSRLIDTVYQSDSPRISLVRELYDAAERCQIVRPYSPPLPPDARHLAYAPASLRFNTVVAEEVIRDLMHLLPPPSKRRLPIIPPSVYDAPCQRSPPSISVLKNYPVLARGGSNSILLHPNNRFVCRVKTKLIEDGNKRRPTFDYQYHMRLFNHPNLVTPLKAHRFPDGKGSMGVYERFYGDGSILSNVPERIMKRYIRQIASAVDYLHDLRIFCGDVDWLNVMLRVASYPEDDQVLLADFSNSFTRGRKFFLEAHREYNSPSNFRVKKEGITLEEGQHSDVYVLGIMALQLMDIPHGGTSAQCNSFVKLCLSEGTTADSLLAHPWLADIDTEAEDF